MVIVLEVSSWMDRDGVLGMPGYRPVNLRQVWPTPELKCQTLECGRWRSRFWKSVASCGEVSVFGWQPTDSGCSGGRVFFESSKRRDILIDEFELHYLLRLPRCTPFDSAHLEEAVRNERAKGMTRREVEMRTPRRPDDNWIIWI